MSDEPILGHVGYSPDFKSGPIDPIPLDQIKRLLAANAARSENRDPAKFVPFGGTNASCPPKDLVPVAEPASTEVTAADDETIRLLPGPLNLGVEVGFTYKNWKGETAERRAVFAGLVWGKNEWHPTPQLLLEGYDLDKKAPRTFAAKDISNVHYL
jgi:hypothetical protein